MLFKVTKIETYVVFVNADGENEADEKLSMLNNGGCGDWDCNPYDTEIIIDEASDKEQLEAEAKA